MQKVLQKFSENLGYYQSIEKNMVAMRDEIVDSIRNQIKSVNIPVDYKFDFNPFKLEISEGKYYEPKYPAKKLSNFNRDMLLNKSKNLYQTF